VYYQVYFKAFYESALPKL